MNRKISTLMASLLFASAFVGTADAALKPLEAGKAPVAGSVYAIGSAFDTTNDKVTDYLTKTPVGSSDATVANFEGLWTVSSGGTDLYILKSPEGKYLKNPAAAERPAELTDNSEDAAKFSFDKAKGSFEITVGDVENYLCFNADNHKLYIHRGGPSMRYAKLATLTADALTAAAVSGGVDANLQASIDKNNYYFVAAAPAGGGPLANVLKATSTSAITTTAYTAVGNEVEDYLWKVSSQKVGTTYIITFENKKFSDNKVIRFAKVAYDNGVNLYANFECTDPAGVDFEATGGNALTLFGIYQSSEAKKTEGELNAILGNGFELTIDTEKNADETIEGIAAFEGTLVAAGNDANNTDETRFQLKNGKKVVTLNTESKWGADNVGVNKRGYKFELMDATDVDDEKQYSWFEFVTNAGATDNKQVNRIDVYNDKSAGSKIGSLYIISIDGKNYLTTSVNKDEDETWPYLYLGSDNIVKVKDLVGKFWKIKYADTRANAKKNEDPYKEEYKYKGILVAQSHGGAANQADYVLASTVYENAPEAQWGVTAANVTDNKVTLSNRETKEIIEGCLSLKNVE